MKKILITVIVGFLTIGLAGQIRVSAPDGYVTVGANDAALSVFDIRNGNGTESSRLAVTKLNSGSSRFEQFGNNNLSIRTVGVGRLLLGANNFDHMYIYPGGLIRLLNLTNFRIESGDLSLIQGEAYKTGSSTWSIISDARLKQNIKKFSMGLDAIMQIEPVTYNYNKKSKADTKKNHVGILAQDIEKIAPFMVKNYEMTDFNRKEDEVKKGTYKSVNTDAFTYMLINGMQEQQKQILELQKQIEILQKFNEVQKNGINNAQNNTNGSTIRTTDKKLNYSEIDLQLEGINLSQNVPNPFSNNTKIQYTIPNDVNQAKVVFTDMNGNIVKSVNLVLGKGLIKVNAAGLPSGIYSYTLVIDGKAKETKKMIIR